MKRRKFLKGAAAGTAVAASTLAAPAIAQGRKEMVIVSTWPRDFPGLGTSAQRLAKRITDVPGASAVFEGGVVAYADEVKVGTLGVSAEDIRREGAVSEGVARQMALGVAKRFGVEAGIGVTGVAGPGGGTAEKPVGTVWLAVALDGEVSTTRLNLVGERHVIRERAAQEALARLLRFLIGSADGA